VKPGACSSAPQPASRVWKTTLSPEAMVSTGARSREKMPCTVPAAGLRRWRAMAQPRGCPAEEEAAFLKLAGLPFTPRRWAMMVSLSPIASLSSTT
jgi:hypothetical protein